MTPQQQKTALAALNTFNIEVPSWGFADTGTRFGKFFQPAAAIDLNDKLADAGQVHKMTGCCPTVAVHVLWDFKAGEDPNVSAKLAKKHGVKIGAINPNVFQDQCYKWGSFGNVDPKVREQALQHCLDSIEIGKAVKSEYLSLWFADGSNFPGTANIRRRREWFIEGLRETHGRLRAAERLLVDRGVLKPGDTYAITCGEPMGYPGGTNMLKVCRVG